MPIDAIPESASVVARRTKVDVQRQLNGSNPFLRMSWLGGIVTGISNRVFEFYHSLEQHSLELMPDTAVEFLGRWAAIWGITRTAATKSTGNIIAIVNAGESVPINTIWKVGDLSYKTLSTTFPIANLITTVTSATVAGTVGTITTSTSHGLASNVPVTISGANEPEYNITNALITVTSSTTFTYAVAGGPANPATGAILWNAIFATIPVESLAFGVEQNQDPDTIMSLETPLIGVADDAQVAFEVFVDGGTSQELDAALRTRFLDRIQNPVSNFNVSAIENQAKTIGGVTRVFVEPITPAVGQVTIYFMRDGDADQIPSAAEVAVTLAKILEIKPATTSDADVIVSAPTAVPTAFTFTALTPNTNAMQAAILVNLQQFFAEATNVGATVDADIYRAIITGSIDTTNGDIVQSFTLNPDPGDITITSGQIATLGTVTPVP